MIAKSPQEAVNMLYSHIEQNTSNENPWIHIRWRDIQETTGISTHYNLKVLELIHAHPNLLCEIDQEGREAKKPLRCRIVTEEEKIQLGFTEKNFRHLKQEQINMIKSKIDFLSYKDMGLMFRLIEYLLGEEADQFFTPIETELLADIMLEEVSTKDVNCYFEKIQSMSCEEVAAMFQEDISTTRLVKLFLKSCQAIKQINCIYYSQQEVKSGRCLQ